MTFICVFKLHLLREDLNASVEAHRWEEHSSRVARHGHLQHRVNDLQASVKSLRDSQAHLENKVNRLQKSSHTIETVESIEEKLYDIDAKFSKIESKVEGNEALLAKLEGSHNGIHEHMKMFEEHSDLQSKEFQLLIDQIHYNITQMQVQSEVSFQKQVNLF